MGKSNLILISIDRIHRAIDAGIHAAISLNFVAVCENIELFRSTQTAENIGKALAVLLAI